VEWRYEDGFEWFGGESYYWSSSRLNLFGAKIDSYISIGGRGVVIDEARAYRYLDEEFYELL